MNADGTIRRLPGDLPCAVCEEWLHFYLEGETDPFLTRAIGSHLEGCAQCAALHRRLEQERVELVEALIRSPALSERFPGRVIDEIRRQEAEERDRRLRSRITRIGLAGTGLAGIAAIAILLSLAGRPPVFSPPVSEGAVVISPTGAAPSPLGAPMDTLPVDPLSRPLTLATNSRPVTIHCPDDAPGRPGAGEVRATLVSMPLGAFPPQPPRGGGGAFPAQTARDGFRLSEAIEFSAPFIREEAVPCTRDVNHDGQTNVSDAAYLFMLAMAAGAVPPRGESHLEGEVDADCMSVCQVY